MTFQKLFTFTLKNQTPQSSNLIISTSFITMHAWTIKDSSRTQASMKYLKSTFNLRIRFKMLILPPTTIVNYSGAIFKTLSIIFSQVKDVAAIILIKQQKIIIPQQMHYRTKYYLIRKQQNLEKFTLKMLRRILFKGIQIVNMLPSKAIRILMLKEMKFQKN